MFSEPYCSVVNVGGGGRGEGKWKLEYIKSRLIYFLPVRKLFLQRISNQNIDKITGQNFILRNIKESIENFLISHQMSLSKEILFRNQ